MDSKLLSSLMDPAILFFFFGLFAAAVRSNLEIPPAVVKFFSLYLLMSIGLKGGAEIAKTGIGGDAFVALGLALFMSALVPAYSFLILRRKMGPYDAAATAATYGSVSAVTFIATGAFLTRENIEFGGHMTVAMVLMESPAIIMAVMLARWVRSRDPATAQLGETLSMGKILREAFTDGAHLLLLGSLAIGAMAGEAGTKVMEPFSNQLFKGILAFFLLEMGLLVVRRMREAGGLKPFYVAFGLVMPIINASIAIALSYLFDLSIGDATLLAALAASASYIVVPAVVRYAIPEAQPSVYFTMALAVTFPFNIVIGIPLYFYIVNTLWGSA